MGYLPGQQPARWPWSEGGRCVQSSCPTYRGNRSTSRAHNPKHDKKFHVTCMCPPHFRRKKMHVLMNSDSTSRSSTRIIRISEVIDIRRNVTSPSPSIINRV
jgi:hypothetical protein